MRCSEDIKPSWHSFGYHHPLYIFVLHWLLLFCLWITEMVQLTIRFQLFICLSEATEPIVGYSTVSVSLTVTLSAAGCHYCLTGTKLHRLSREMGCMKTLSRVVISEWNGTARDWLIDWAMFNVPPNTL